MTTQEEYKAEYKKFCDEFDIQVNPAARRGKLGDEIEEYGYTRNDSPEEIDELIDIFNSASSLLWSLGVDDPLKAGIEKLHRNAERYRRIEAYE